MAARLGVKPETTDLSDHPVVIAFASAGLLDVVLAAGIRGFMDLAICPLAMLKRMDVEAVAASIRKDDMLTQRSRTRLSVVSFAENLIMP